MTTKLNWKKNETLKNGNTSFKLLFISLAMLTLFHSSNAQTENICRIKSSYMNMNTGQIDSSAFIYVGPHSVNGAVGGDYPCDARIAISLEDITRHIHSSASPYNSTLAANGNIDHPADGTGDNGKRASDNELTIQQIRERITTLKPGYIEGPYGMKWMLEAEQLKALYPSSTFDVQYHGGQRTVVDYQNLFFEMLVTIQLLAKQHDEQLTMIEQQAATINRLSERLVHIENALNVDAEIIPHKAIGEVSINPNPITNGNLQVSYQLNEYMSKAMLVIIDIQGKQVYESSLYASQKSGNQNLKIDLPAGTYLYYLENLNQQTNTKKITIQ